MQRVLKDEMLLNCNFISKQIYFKIDLCTYIKTANFQIQFVIILHFCYLLISSNNMQTFMGHLKWSFNQYSYVF